MDLKAAGEVKESEQDWGIACFTQMVQLHFLVQNTHISIEISKLNPLGLFPFENNQIIHQRNIRHTHISVDTMGSLEILQFNS